METLAGCTPTLPDNIVVLAEQPTSTEIHMADGIFVKTMLLPTAGVYVPQHSHSFAHVSVVVKGAVRLWRDGVFVGDYRAPVGITIAAHTKHMFLSLEDETRVLCVHDIGCAEAVSVEEENSFEGDR